MPFHAGKDGVYIVLNWFEFGAQQCHLPDFRGPGGTTVITGQYYRLALLGDRAQAVPPSDKGGTTAQLCSETELKRYHRLTRAVLPLGIPGRLSS